MPPVTLRRWLAATAMLAAALLLLGAAPRVPAANRIGAAELAKAMAGPRAGRPVVLHVGFRVLYRSGHITGTPFAGPGSKPEGIRALQDALRRLRRTTPVVLYCGCCPWVHCPNVEPALNAARAMGFESVRVLYLPKDFQTDWVDRKLPTAS